LVPFDPALRPDPASPLAVRAFRYVWPDRLHRLGYSRTLKRDVGLRLVAYLEAPLYFAFAARALSRLVARQGIDLVHAHWLLPNGYVACRAAAASSIPFAVTLHGSDVFMAERNPLFARLARRALDGAAYVTSCSAELRDRLLALGGSRHAAKIHLVPNGADLAPEGAAGAAAAQAMRRRLGLRPGDRLVVAVGRLVDKKGFGHLVAAAPELVAGRPEVRVVIGGGGDLEPALREQASALGLGERLLFTGALSHPEVLDLIAGAEVFVMPSVRDRRGNVDGLPVVVLEAMAAGKPVVATDVSGLPLAIEDGRSGLLVPEKDPQALARATASLLADPAKARELGEAGRRRVREELNWDAVAARHDALLRRAVEEAR
jgi:glycosyltransferase involved in cell wall biosynthesis